MNILQALILGVIQGITEFFPISSSGHLIIFQHWFGLQEPQLTFDVFVHLATSLAVIFFFRKKILKLNNKQLFIICLANIPAMVIGLLFKDQLELIFSNLNLVAIMLLITGIINFISDKKLNQPAENQKTDFPNAKQGLFVGLFQALAITPGISRSGSTVFAGLQSKLNREQAFSFSFLVGIPAILGANLLQMLDLIQGEGGNLPNLAILITGFITALITGLLSLKIFDLLIKKARLEFFAFYCFLMSGLVLIINLFF